LPGHEHERKVEHFYLIPDELVFTQGNDLQGCEKRPAKEGLMLTDYLESMNIKVIIVHQNVTLSAS
jgi:hypothetical protein